MVGCELGRIRQDHHGSNKLVLSGDLSHHSRTGSIYFLLKKFELNWIEAHALYACVAFAHLFLRICCCTVKLLGMWSALSGGVVEREDCLWWQPCRWRDCNGGSRQATASRIWRTTLVVSRFLASTTTTPSFGLGLQWGWDSGRCKLIFVNCTSVIMLLRHFLMFDKDVTFFLVRYTTRVTSGNLYICTQHTM